MRQSRGATRHLSRRQREARYAWRVTAFVLLLASAAVVAVLLTIAPRTKPVVTVYMPDDCGTCRRWMKHLAARGFRTQIGDSSEWPSIRAQFRLPPAFRSSHTAVVEGLLIEGPVPAREVHAALAWRTSNPVRGLVVPGVPRGSPGTDSPLPQPFTVFAVREGGLMVPFARYDH